MFLSPHLRRLFFSCWISAALKSRYLPLHISRNMRQTRANNSPICTRNHYRPRVDMKMAEKQVRNKKTLLPILHMGIRAVCKQLLPDVKEKSSNYVCIILLIYYINKLNRFATLSELCAKLQIKIFNFLHFGKIHGSCI